MEQTNTMSTRKRQRGGEEEGKAAGASTVAGVLALNHLTYDTFADLSVVQSRVAKESKFQDKSYGPNDIARCTLNTGDSFINPRGCFIKFRVYNRATDGEGDRFFEQTKFDSALNFFNRFQMTDRSGHEIENIEGVNKIKNLMRVAHYNQDWRHAYGSLFTPTFVNGSYTGIIPESTIAGDYFEWVIPLACISDLFDRDQLLPPQLMAGLRLDFTLERADVVTMWNDAFSNYNYELTDMVISMDCCTVSDSVARRINLEAETVGIKLELDTYTRIVNLTQDTNVNLESRKAISRAMSALVMARAVGPAGDDQSGILSMNAIQLDAYVQSYQWRVGSTFYPQQRETIGGPPTVTGQVNSRAVLFYAHQMFQRGAAIRVGSDYNIIDMAGPVEAPDEDDPNRSGMCGIIPLWLNRVEGLSVSGVPLNNSQPLTLEITLITPPEVVLEYTMYILHKKRVTVFLNNLELEE